MFSVLLSSEEDFPIPVDTSKPDPGAVSHLPVIEEVPELQAQYPLPQVSQQSLPSPPPPSPPASLPLASSAPSVPNITSIPAALPSASLPSTFTASRQTDAPKRSCDDDVLFVSEKPVKKRRLDTPPRSNLARTQQQTALSHKASPPLPHAADQQGQEKVQYRAPPAANHTHGLAAGPVHEYNKGEVKAMARRASLSSLEHYVFPTRLSSGPLGCRKEFSPISPKQTPDNVTPGLLQRPSSQPATPSENSLCPPQHPADNGRPNGNTIRKNFTNETGTSSDPLGQKVPVNGDAEPATTETSASVTQMQPMGEETVPQVTASSRNPEMPASEASYGNGPATNAKKPFESHHRSKSQECLRQQQQGPTTQPTTTLPSGQSNSWPSTPTNTSTQKQSISPANFVPRAYPSGQQNSTTGTGRQFLSEMSPLDKTATMEGPHSTSLAPNPSTPQSMGMAGLARPRGGGRSPTQLQPQLSSPSPVRPQFQMYSQAHTQTQHSVGHPPGPGLSKANCKICAARRQQLARQNVAAAGGGMAVFPDGALPPGNMSLNHAPSANGAGYSVVYVPTPMQGSNGPGAQFTHTSQATSKLAGTMGQPRPYTLQNPQLGPAMVPSVPQARRMVEMTNQATPPRPEPRISPQQVPPPRKLPHQEPSPGKHITVDIADTAMEVFPFSKIAKRHNVGVDKVRNIFEAVVAVPFLRVPADKRRAGKIGQERMKGYLAAKKEIERDGGGRDGLVSAHEVARVMGPEALGEWAQRFSGPF